MKLHPLCLLFVAFLNLSSAYASDQNEAPKNAGTSSCELILLETYQKNRNAMFSGEAIAFLSSEKEITTTLDIKFLNEKALEDAGAIMKAMGLPVRLSYNTMGGFQKGVTLKTTPENARLFLSKLANVKSVVIDRDFD